MADWYGYFAGEDLNLTPAQRQTIYNLLFGLGQDDSSFQPARRLHKRMRTDDKAAIIEAVFNEDSLSISAFRQLLADTFGVNPASIDVATATPTFAVIPSIVTTFSRLGVNYFRLGLFGGTTATHEQSRIETVAYLVTHRTEWGDLFD